ncbi:MAG: HesA/MoeB/ThiF family protein [Planctomycetota bacterium]|jgi:adenylyltransferase/sulfurtransferase
MERYHRQMILPDWGVETQKKLKRAKVFVAGAGGLGCPASLNLTLAGVGKIRICDSDVVEMSNLNRQFLHMEERIGTNKVDSAQATLTAINSEIIVETVFDRITDENVDDIVGDSQLILDCVDNFPTRLTLNKCSIRKGIPMVHGAIWGLEGRVTFLSPPATPCLECIFPKSPSREEIPVLGAVPCTIGSLQALETIKYLTGKGELLSGRMLIVDCSTMEFQELEVSKDPECSVCGQSNK